MKDQLELPLITDGNKKKKKNISEKIKTETEIKTRNESEFNMKRQFNKESKFKTINYLKKKSKTQPHFWIYNKNNLGFEL